MEPTFLGKVLHIQVTSGYVRHHPDHHLGDGQVMGSYGPIDFSLPFLSLFSMVDFMIFYVNTIFFIVSMYFRMFFKTKQHDKKHLM